MTEFSRWTMREVDVALKKITIRNHNAFAMRASLHGITIPKMNLVSPAEKAHDNVMDDGAVDVALQKALKRKQTELSHGS